jgi:L-ascorbate metabolism protein UlaG (beta-lactamase superfamily)
LTPHLKATVVHLVGMNKETVRLTLIGGPTLLIEFAGLRIVTDPTFDQPQSYQTGGITLTKRTSPALALQQVLPIDIVLVSHEQHFDNLDHAGRTILPQSKQVFTTPAGAPKLGSNAIGLPTWASKTLRLSDRRNLTITSTPARHGPHGFEPISGDVTGFLLQLEGTPAIYVSGDTVWYSALADIPERFPVGLAILFTGAAEPRGPFAVTMTTNDAVEAAAHFKDAVIVAIHNEGWAHFTQTQQDVTTAFKVVGIDSRLQPLEPGRPTTIAL